MTTTKPEKLNVVTSFLPIQSHTQAITGEFANVKLLLAKDPARTISSAANRYDERVAGCSFSQSKRGSAKIESL